MTGKPSYLPAKTTAVGFYSRQRSFKTERTTYVRHGPLSRPPSWPLSNLLNNPLCKPLRKRRNMSNSHCSGQLRRILRRKLRRASPPATASLKTRAPSLPPHAMALSLFRATLLHASAISYFASMPPFSSGRTFYPATLNG